MNIKDIDNEISRAADFVKDSLGDDDGRRWNFHQLKLVAYHLYTLGSLHGKEVALGEINRTINEEIKRAEREIKTIKGTVKEK